MMNEGKSSMKGNLTQYTHSKDTLVESNNSTHEIMDKGKSNNIQGNWTQHSHSEHIILDPNSRGDTKMIDFIIAGFGKCGTTTLMNSLNTKETFLGYENADDLKEIHLLRKSLVNEFKAMYEDHIQKKNADGKPILNGFKSPEVLMSEEFIKNIESEFPDADLIVSTRHPVLHFQSMYNYKFRSSKFSDELPDPLSLIGNCAHQCFSNCVPIEKGKNRGVCTGKSQFQYGLSRIMLTPMNTTHELDLLDNIDWSRHPGFQGNLFLLELGQMADKNTTRKNMFTNDMEDFLGLDANTVDLTRQDRSEPRENFIDICDERNKPIRDVLIETGTKASTWIRDYLLKSPRVTISNSDHFLQLINKWKSDPCEE